MKISQKQANLLAHEIVRQLKAKKVDRISDTLRIQLSNFLKERKQLQEVVEKAEQAVEVHAKQLKKIAGNVNNLQPYQTLEQMVERIEAKNIPSVSSIEDEIILKSMFKSEDDMETFVNAIVKKYEKKLQNKILSN